MLIICFHIWQQSLFPVDIAGTVVVYALLAISSVLSRGQLGMGDAFLFVLTGLGLGIMANIFIIMLSFILAFCAAVFLVAIKHKPYNYCMPLAPFVLGSFICYLAEIYIPL